MAKTYSILIIDDHEIVREGLTAILKKHHLAHEVGHATNGKEGLEYLRQYKFDLVLCDIKMPVMDGHETARQIISQFPAVRIIMLSMYDNVMVLAAFMKLGVNGYLCKADVEINKAVIAVMARETFISKTLQESRDFQPDYLPELKPREIELIELLAQGHTTGEVSTKLGITPSTVETYRKDVLKKFHVHSTVELVDLMHRIGKL